MTEAHCLRKFARMQNKVKNTPYSYATQIEGPFVIAEKVHGLNTHANNTDGENAIGLCELLTSQLGLHLDVLHRLDQVTSGIIMFSSDKTITAQVMELFKNHQISKKYLFLTDRKYLEKQFVRKSFITKKKNTFESIQGPFPHGEMTVANSETEFKFVKTVGQNYLWMAIPKTGRPHQIRLHAQDAGIPVLGDLEHGGSPAYRVFLHSLELQFSLNNKTYYFQSKQPHWTEESTQSAFLDAATDRNTIFSQMDPQETLRWVHHESLQFRMDQFGQVLWVYWYDSNLPTELDLNHLKEFAKNQGKYLEVRYMINRGQTPTTASRKTIIHENKNQNLNETKVDIFSSAPEQWVASENGVQFQFRRNQGLSPGLFLDQRSNRHWLRSHSARKSVLNLFSYTGGFSVNAALGMAAEVCTVDLSKSFIEWSKENFRLNKLDPDKYEFRVCESLIYLRGLKKRSRKFDIIVVDPPSFSRSSEGIFKIERDWEKLLDLCMTGLTPNGEILFATNFEKWSTTDWLKILRPWASSQKKELEEMPGSLDCDRPGRRNSSLMKSFRIY